MSGILQTKCREYLKKLTYHAKKISLNDTLKDLIKQNEEGTCVATKQQVEMLAAMCDDDSINRKDIPKVIGKSYRACEDNNLFDKLKKRKRRGIYSKIDVLLFAEKEKKKNESN